MILVGNLIPYQNHPSTALWEPCGPQFWGFEKLEFRFFLVPGQYVAAKGQTLLDFETDEGATGSWVFQLASVNKALGSVSKLTDQGGHVIHQTYCPGTRKKRIS